jgi:hypothetical protein
METLVWKTEVMILYKVLFVALMIYSKSQDIKSCRFKDI